MNIRFSDHDGQGNAPHFAEEGEEVCGKSGLTMVVPDGGEHQLHCELVKGHEGQHCSRTPGVAQADFVRRQIQMAKEQLAQQ